jgi:hypothetical protein
MFFEGAFFVTKWQLKLKVAFSQKGLLGSSFLQADEPNYFPELEFRFFFILNGSNHVKKELEAALMPFLSIRSSFMSLFDMI